MWCNLVILFNLHLWSFYFLEWITKKSSGGWFCHASLVRFRRIYLLNQIENKKKCWSLPALKARFRSSGPTYNGPWRGERDLDVEKKKPYQKDEKHFYSNEWAKKLLIYTFIFHSQRLLVVQLIFRLLILLLFLSRPIFFPRAWWPCLVPIPSFLVCFFYMRIQIWLSFSPHRIIEKIFDPARYINYTLENLSSINAIIFFFRFIMMEQLNLFGSHHFFFFFLVSNFDLWWKKKEKKL